MIQNFEYFMLPLLKIISKHQRIFLKDAIVLIKQQEKYTDEDLSQTIKSGASVIDNRIAWAKTYLKGAGLIEQPSRGSQINISSEGLSLLNQQIECIDKKFLYLKCSKYREWIEAFNSKAKSNEIEVQSNAESKTETPEEELTKAYDSMKSTTCSDLLDILYSVDPYKFEKIILDLLVRMGYGKAIETKRSNDEGIDGIINKDVLGLEKIYIQVKRYNKHNKISRPTLQGFVGSIHNKDSKGLFITTSNFTPEAVEYAKQANLVIINGIQLTELMFDYDFGVQTRTTLNIKHIDDDFFNDE